jgi:hypothetical protein
VTLWLKKIKQIHSSGKLDRLVERRSEEGWTPTDSNSSDPGTSTMHDALRGYEEHEHFFSILFSCNLAKWKKLGSYQLRNWGMVILPPILAMQVFQLLPLNMSQLGIDYGGGTPRMNVFPGQSFAVNLTKKLDTMYSHVDGDYDNFITRAGSKLPNADMFYKMRARTGPLTNVAGCPNACVGCVILTRGFEKAAQNYTLTNDTSKLAAVNHLTAALEECNTSCSLCTPVDPTLFLLGCFLPCAILFAWRVDAFYSVPFRANGNTHLTFGFSRVPGLNRLACLKGVKIQGTVLITGSIPVILALIANKLGWHEPYTHNQYRLVLYYSSFLSCVLVLQVGANLCLMHAANAWNWESVKAWLATTVAILITCVYIALAQIFLMGLSCTCSDNSTAGYIGQVCTADLSCTITFPQALFPPPLPP